MLFAGRMGRSDEEGDEAWPTSHRDSGARVRCVRGY